MGRLFLAKLEGRCYTCIYCGNHLANSSDLLSRTFHSRAGKAYLFDSVALVNIVFGDQEERMMTTGLHEVSDIHCKKCMQMCGWRYDVAHEDKEKYKEGKFILERKKLVAANNGAAPPVRPAVAADSSDDSLARYPHRLLPASVARFAAAARAPHHGYPDTDSDPEACV
ncbi:hypothetical protein WJX81_003425 [Elliptochloris bilobata]|uniref:Yippee domain-containing protein n=1 Tax=Elliptochloris bilobata TaxID=381761 RepID=A0AAW1S992_9CHLO